MSTKVAIVYEDHTYDRYILEPIVEAALKHIGVVRPRVSSVTNPRLSGFATLLAKLCDVISRYEKTVSAIVVAFDLDGEDGTPGKGDKMAKVRSAIEACDTDASNVVLLGCRQEAEVFAIWGSRDKVRATWDEVRMERDPKEQYFNYLINQTDLLAIDGGRSRLVRLSLAKGWRSLSRACEELATLERELQSILRI